MELFESLQFCSAQFLVDSKEQARVSFSIEGNVFNLNKVVFQKNYQTLYVEIFL